MKPVATEEVKQYMGGWRVIVDSDAISAEELESANLFLKEFSAEQAHRYALTANLIPNVASGSKLVEIGSAPYLMSMYVHHQLGYDVTHINLDHDRRISAPIHMENPETGDSSDINWLELNVEFDSLSIEDNSQDVVLCCEVIEHLTVSPVHMLGEIHRILKPHGTLVLTTPNALRIAHFMDLSRGKNIHDRFRKDYEYGAYSRHNREFTPSELYELLNELGYSVSDCSTKDIYPTTDSLSLRLEQFWLSIPFLGRSLLSKRMDARRDMKNDLIFIKATKEREFRAVYPESIFYPPGL